MMRFFGFLVALALVLGAGAQDFRATISGQVTDHSWAAIANAKVRATQRSTNEVAAAVTNQDGFYTLSYLQPSTYDVEVEAPGFSRMRRQSVTLMVAEKLDLPFQLEVGAVTENVTVSASIVEVETADASGGL